MGGIRPLGGKGDSRGVAQALANRTLVWPKQLEAFGLNPDKYQQWEDNTRAEFQTAVELKVASGDHLYLPWALGRETIAVDVKVGQRALRWVQYLRIDAFGDSHPCAASGINLELQARLDALLPETPSKDLIEYTMATIYTADKESKTKVDWRVIYNRALERLWDDIEGWNALEAESAARKTDVEFLKTLGTLRQSWPGNYNQTDRYRERRRGRFAAGQNLLYMMPEDTILWLVDKNGKTFGFHHPTAIQEAYGDEAVKRIFSNIETYFSVEPPRLPDAHRHPFHKEFLTANPQFQKDNGGFSGCAHIGHWHMTGYEDSEVSPDAIRTKDSRPASAHAEKLLHQLLKHACGHVTRVVDRWFGVVDPVLRARYKRVYKESSEYCGLPTSEEEIACLRAFLLRVQTESHTDLRDWKHGYAWMTPFGDFTGAALCLPELGIQIPFPVGSLNGILGRDFIHFTTDWEGIRDCVVHTTHDSVRAQVEQDDAKSNNVEEHDRNESEGDGGGRIERKRKRGKGLREADGDDRDTKKRRRGTSASG